MRKGEQILVSAVSLMNCTSVGLNLLSQSSKAATVLVLCPLREQHSQLESETLPNVLC